MRGARCCRPRGAAQARAAQARAASAGPAAQPFRLGHGRCLLRLTGKDTRSMLQGMATNDLRLLSDAAPLLYCGFLNARGRMVADALLHHRPDEEILIDVAAGCSEGLQRHLSLHRLRAKVEIARAAGVVPAAGLGPFQSAGGGLAAPDPRLPAPGEEGEEPPGVLAPLYRGVVESPEGDYAEGPDWRLYTLHRVLCGLPEGPCDIPQGGGMPLECNFDFCAGVSFNKGCYVGQELTARTHHRGVTRKRLVPVALGAPVPDVRELWQAELAAGGGALRVAEQPDSEVGLVTAADGQSAGSLRTVVEGLSNGGGVGMALLRLEKIAWEEPCLATADGRQVWPLVPQWWPDEEGTE
eukprot:TRINITY_DN55583_c0_g1_i1.p1 TRINITY_DN55583_c0_g1~~TRINITY_DN55583_c0_g1_i1.p1  ORF type:complete len:354 (+),score=101.24 TRINITY_DN55583_c0_g1_i1:72-1133(+)